VAGVLTEAGGRRFEVKYGGDCALMHLNPTPSSKVAQPQVLGDLQPPFLPALCKNSRTAQECTHNLPKNNALNEHTECTPYIHIFHKHNKVGGCVGLQKSTRFWVDMILARGGYKG